MKAWARIRIYIAAMLYRGHCRDTGVPDLGIERTASTVKTLLTGVIYESLINPDYVDFRHLAEVLEHTLDGCLARTEPAQAAARTPTFT